MPAGPSAFGKYLRAKRKAARMSQSEVGERLGVSHAYLSGIERGARPPLRREHWAKLISAVPGVTVGELERSAAMTRSLDIELRDAPADYVEVALALASRAVPPRDAARAERPL